MRVYLETTSKPFRVSCIGMIASLVLVGCTAKDATTTTPSPTTAITTSDSALDFSAMTVPANAVPDGTLIPPVPEAHAWTPSEIDDLTTPGYGNDLREQIARTGDQVLPSFLKILQESGITVTDPTQSNLTVVAPKERSHNMFVIAGNVVLYQNLLSSDYKFDLDTFINTFVSGVPQTGVSADVWRTYIADALAQASTPSEVAWRDYIDPDGSLATSVGAGHDIQLAPVQMILLIARMQGDMLTSIAADAAVPSASDSPNVTTRPATETHSATTASLQIVDAAMQGRARSDNPCSWAPIPDWAFTGTANVAGEAWTDLLKHLPEYGEEFGEATGTVLGWLGLAATIASFLATKWLFKADISDATPLTRTKSTTNDAESEPLTASFSVDPPVGLWANCLRFIAAIKGIDAALPEPGPWSDASVNWSVQSGPGVFLGPPRATNLATKTDKDGRTTVNFAARAQDRDKSSVTTSFQNPATVQAVVNPESMTSGANRLMQWLMNAIELVLSVLLGGINGGEVDVAAKAAIYIIDNFTNFWSTPPKVIPITDWADLWLTYTVHLTWHDDSRTSSTSTCGVDDTTVDETGDFLMTGKVMLTGSADDPTSLSGSDWIVPTGQPVFTAIQTQTDAAALDCGLGEPGSCPSAVPRFTTTEQLIGVSKGVIDVTVNGLGTVDQAITLTPSGISETVQLGGNECQTGTQQTTHFLDEFRSIPPAQDRFALGLGAIVLYTGPFTSGPGNVISTLTSDQSDPAHGLTSHETFELAQS